MFHGLNTEIPEHQIEFETTLVFTSTATSISILKYQKLHPTKHRSIKSFLGDIKFHLHITVTIYYQFPKTTPTETPDSIAFGKPMMLMFILETLTRPYTTPPTPDPKRARPVWPVD